MKNRDGNNRGLDIILGNKSIKRILLTIALFIVSELALFLGLMLSGDNYPIYMVIIPMFAIFLLAVYAITSIIDWSKNNDPQKSNNSSGEVDLNATLLALKGLETDLSWEIRQFKDVLCERDLQNNDYGSKLIKILEQLLENIRLNKPNDKINNVYDLKISLSAMLIGLSQASRQIVDLDRFKKPTGKKVLSNVDGEQYERIQIDQQSIKEQIEQNLSDTNRIPVSGCSPDQETKK